MRDLASPLGLLVVFLVALGCVSATGPGTPGTASTGLVGSRVCSIECGDVSGSVECREGYFARCECDPPDGRGIAVCAPERAE